MVRSQLAGLALLAAACTGAPPTPPFPPPAPTTAGRLVQDLEYALAVIEARHPDPFHAHPRREFLEPIESLRARGEALTREEAFLELMRMVALVEDSHTRLGDLDEVADPELPVYLEWWCDGLWMASVQADRADLCSARVLTLEGRSPEELAAALAPWIPHENEVMLRRNAAAMASLPRVLRAAGIVPDLERVRFDLIDPLGQRRSVEIPPRPRGELGVRTWIAPQDWIAPLHRERRDEPWWWRELDDGRALYLQYNRCIRRAEAPFEDTVAELLGRLGQSPDQGLIVDLRNNGGGDSSVLRPLLRGLERRGREAPLVVLIGPGTFSSGMLNAWQLRERCGAVLVGEPTGQKPDCFGELSSISLPTTGWRLDVSTKRFRVVGDERPSLAPDQLVPSGHADLLAGRDPALERALELCKGGQ